MNHAISFMIFLLLAALAPLNAAEMKLAAVFSDHIVLQRDKPAPVWGWADQGEQITVEFAGQKKTATADAGGKWMVKLDAMPASAEARTLVVRSAKENRSAQANDVLVGEVWLGSGQSNMALTVSRARDFEAEKAAANQPLIRMFREESPAAKSPQPDGKGNWLVCSPETVGGFSATLYFFGRELRRELNVPVGLINSSVGGTPIESWIAAEAQAHAPELKAAIEAGAKADAEFDEAKAKADYEKALARWNEQVAKAKAAGQRSPRKPANPLEQRARKGAGGGLFNGKIAPLIPYAIRGAVWYQGEANANPAKGPLYQFQLPLLVTDWRARWGEEFPFAWVQLPNYKRDGEGWMLVREAMLKTLRLPHTGMAIAIDIGESGNIHPQNKQEVGRRLALWALSEVYGKKVAATCGPLPSGNETRGAEMVISFTHAEGGLQAKGGELKGFVIAGEDRQWKIAQARIEGAKVIVSNPEVKKPVAIRYAWEPDPVCNLVNGAGLPASPFRTDDWPAASAQLEKNSQSKGQPGN
ncbi:MAG: sialate O-acetylesterase [Candidatus Sumerlaeota bacterium]|nr:sialate O-acetylesterase [Candidatus Sumerlaeota bacterium]